MFPTPGNSPPYTTSDGKHKTKRICVHMYWDKENDKRARVGKQGNREEREEREREVEGYILSDCTLRHIVGTLD